MLPGSVSGQESCCEYRWLLGSACLPGARSGTAEPVPPGLCQHRGHPRVLPAAALGSRGLGWRSRRAWRDASQGGREGGREVAFKFPGGSDAPRGWQDRDGARGHRAAREQVPAKAPSAEVHHPAIRGEMHVGLGAAGPWQGGPGRAWRASLANEPGLLLPVSALTDEQISSPSISLPPLHLCHPRFSPLREDLELVPCSSRQPLPSGQALQQLARAGGILGTALAQGDRLRACSPRSASVCPRLGCAFPTCPAASVLFSS